MATNFQVRVSDDGEVAVTDVARQVHMAVVPGMDAKIGSPWNRSGVYFLLGVGVQPMAVYVGKANELNKRIAQPHDRMPEWNRALLVCRPSAHFDEAEALWLEGRLYELLKRGRVDLKNGQIPGGGKALDQGKQESLEDHVVPYIKGALVLLGCDVSETLDPASQVYPRQGGELARDSTEEPMTIGKVHRRTLDVVVVGTVIKSTTHRYRHATATVEATGVRYDGILYRSATVAAKAVTGHKAVDGWSFWGVEGKTGRLTKLKEIRDGNTPSEPNSGHDQSPTRKRTRISIGKVHRKTLDVVGVGTVIRSTTRRYRHATATVEATGVRYDGHLYASLTAAAKAGTGYKTVDGWSFWGVQGKTGQVTKLKDIRDGTSPAEQQARSDHDQYPTHKQARMTPKRMSAAMRARLLARRDEGATHVELQREFHMTKGGVFKVLKEGGRVDSR